MSKIPYIYRNPINWTSDKVGRILAAAGLEPDSGNPGDLPAAMQAPSNYFGARVPEYERIKQMAKRYLGLE